MTVAIIVIGALILVPGAGAALAFAPPGAISIESRIALVFGLGYALVAGVAILLALAHVFSRPTYVAGVVLATAAVWSVALRRVSPRVYASTLRAQAREAPFALAAGLALLLAFAVSRFFYPAGSTLAIRSAWRYWADGLEVAAAGHIPGKAAQWGTEIPTTVSKVVLNTFEGGVSFLLGPEPLPAMHGILIVAAVGLVAALLALGRELGLGIFAPLVPVLTVLVPERVPFSHEMSIDLKSYTAEDIGRMAAFCALLTGIYAVRARDGRGPVVVTGALLAVAGLTHLVPTLVVGAMLVFFAPAALLVDRVGLRRAVVRGAGIAAVFGICFLGVLGLSGGDLGLQRATSGAAFAGFPPGVDPTRSFSAGKLVAGPEKEGHFLIPPREILRRYAEDVVGSAGAAWFGVLTLAVLALGTVAIVVRARSLIPLAAVAWGLVATTLAVAFFFSFRYDTVIPGNFALRRLYDYIALVPALLVPAVLTTLTRPLAGRNRAAVAALTLVTVLLSLAAVVDRTPRDRSLSSADAGVAVTERVAEVVPCGARMLANARTAGFWEATTGRRAVTEGMAPFLRPGVLERILPVLVGANEFFDHPQANRDFLARQRIQYLVVVKPNVWFGWGGTGRGPAPSDAEKIASVPGVHPIFSDRLVSIFAVGSTDLRVTDRQPRHCPV
jgi:hypothetical protein